MLVFGLFITIGGLFLMFWGLHYFGLFVSTTSTGTK